MTIKSQLDRIKNRIVELWHYKIFKLTVVVHGFYFILSMILVLVFFRDHNDFLVYFKVGEVFTTNITDLYNQQNYLWDFRYFPISAFFFVPFYLLGFDIGFVLFEIFNLILNIFISIILYKIIILIRREDHEKEDNRIIVYVCIYLLAIPQLFNYIMGQINLYITFLILLSLYIYLKHEDIKWELIASVILGISIIIKPITLFMIPFLIILKFDREKRKISFNLKKSIIRIIGVLIPLSLNVIYFLLYPELLSGFIETNFTRQTFVELNFSISITRLLINLSIIFNLSIGQIIIFLGVLFVIGGVALISHIFGKFERNPIIYGYLYGILIMFLAYFDTWDHHLLILTPILIILIFNLTRQSVVTNKTIKPTLLFLSFFDLLFMGIYILTEPFFPFNFASTTFLILTFYIIAVNSLKSKKNDIRG